MALTFAGVHLPVVTPGVVAWFDSVQPMELFDRWNAWNFQGTGLDYLPTPSLPLPPKFQLGVLSWPTKASRPAWFHFVVNTTILNEIRAALPAAGTPSVLHMDDGRTGKSIDASMYMLPAVPLNQLGNPDRDGWLVSLTDQRFFFQWNRKKVGPFDTDAFPGSWEEMHTLLGADLLPAGVSTESVPAAYLTPTEKWVSYYQPPGTLLDAVAAQVGHLVVFALDGTARSISWSTAKAEADAQYAAAPTAIAGGRFSTADIGRLVPASVKALFPDDTNPATPPIPYEVEYTLAGLAISPYGSATGFPGRSGIVYGDATYDGSNAAAIAAYAMQAAYDWYGWRLPDINIAFPGIEPWVPTGWENTIEWTYQVRGNNEPFASTRLVREEWDEFASGGIPPQPVNQTGGAGTVTWYTAYHHLDVPAMTPGAILRPGDLVGYVASIPGGAHSHFSLGDGSSFLRMTPGYSVDGQTLLINDWTGWPVSGTHAAVPEPPYYPPRFECTTNQLTAQQFIKSVFAPWLVGTDWEIKLGSTEHKYEEYWAVDVYPPGVTPGTGDESMAGTPVYLAIADVPEAQNIVNEVVFAGFIDSAVGYMVIVKHTTCPCGPTPFQITNNYDPIAGYTWEKMSFDFSPYADIPKAWVVVDPPITGDRLFETNDNRTLVPGMRGLMWPTPVGYEFTVQEEFPARLTSTYNGALGYDWESMDDNTITGNRLFDISGNVSFQIGDKMWVRRHGQPPPAPGIWLADRPVLKLGCGIVHSVDTDEYSLDLSGLVTAPLTWNDETCGLSLLLGCGLDVSGGALVVDLSDAAQAPLSWDAINCTLDLLFGCGLYIDPDDKLAVNNIDIAGVAAVTAMVPVGGCAVGVDLTDITSTDEDLVVDVSLTPTGGGITMGVTKQTYRNYFNAAGLHIDRAPFGGTSVTYTVINICDAIACCEAETLTSLCTKSGSGGEAPYSVDFTATPSGGIPPYTYLWSFGDGNTDTTQNPTYIYLVGGTYSPSVTVTDSCGQTVVCSPGTITVTDPIPPPACNCTTAPVITAPFSWTGDFSPCQLPANPSRAYFKFNVTVSGNYYARIKANSGFGAATAVWCQINDRGGSCLLNNTWVNVWPTHAGFMAGWTCGSVFLTAGLDYYVELYYGTTPSDTDTGNMTLEVGSGTCPP